VGLWYIDPNSDEEEAEKAMQDARGIFRTATI
jgi:hypothetical protein